MRTNAKLHWLMLAAVLAACNAKSADSPVTHLPNPPTELVVIQPALEDIKWTTYIFDAGVSLEYPDDWIIVSSEKDAVEFSGFPYSPDSVIVHVLPLPIENKVMADPHSLTESKEKVLWEKPISIENADGLEFIWGIPAANQISGNLVAIYYSEQHEIEVTLHVHADAIPTESNKFSVFEYMVQSVRIAP